MFTPHGWQRALLLASLAGAAATSIGYFLRGYHSLLLYLWLLSFILAGGCFFLRQYAGTPLRLSDWQLEWCCVAGLLIGFAPLYLASLYTIPVQIGSDEIVVLNKSRHAASLAHPDIFGLTPFFRLPLFIFILYGRLASALGGITVSHLRLIHACSALVAILASYGLFRLSLPRWPAVGATILLGANHALIGLSRMALRENTALVIEVATLALLLRSVQRRNMLLAFLGGVVCGLSFYTYFPARVTVALWLVWIALLIRRSPRQHTVPSLLTLTAAGLLGWGMAIGPMASATIKEYPQSVRYMRQQFIFYPEGRQLQQTWWGEVPPTPAIPEVIRKNIRNGLLMFNGTSGSGTLNYFHPGHGFVDPLTGMVLWVGLVYLLFGRRTRRTNEELMMVTGFLCLWLGFSFLTTKNPDYDRLLVLLPFTAYLAMRGLVTVADGVGRLLQRAGIRWSVPAAGALVGAAVAVSAAWNLRIYGAYVKTSLTRGDVLGGVVRYMDVRRQHASYSYYLLGDPPAAPYPLDFPHDRWEYYLWTVRGPQQQTQLMTPDAVLTQPPQACPLTLFMTGTLWVALEPALRRQYPELTVHRLTPDAGMLALEIASCAPRTAAP